MTTTMDKNHVHKVREERGGREGEGRESKMNVCLYTPTFSKTA